MAGAPLFANLQTEFYHLRNQCNGERSWCTLENSEWRWR